MLNILNKSCQGNFTQVPNEIIRDHSLSPRAFKLYVWFASNDKNFQLSVSIICKVIGCKDERTWIPIKNELVKRELIKVSTVNGRLKIKLLGRKITKKKKPGASNLPAKNVPNVPTKNAGHNNTKDLNNKNKQETKEACGASLAVVSILNNYGIAKKSLPVIWAAACKNAPDDPNGYIKKYLSAMEICKNKLKPHRPSGWLFRHISEGYKIPDKWLDYIKQQESETLRLKVQAKNEAIKQAEYELITPEQTAAGKAYALQFIKKNYNKGE